MSKVLKGGNIEDPFLQIKTFMSMIIFGYFGVKIVYGLFFQFYPEKFYYRNVEINTSDSDGVSEENTKTIALNAYMPGMWNTEITDFVVTVILAFIVYIYTNMGTRSMINYDGNLSSGLLIGYIIGLGYPPFQKTIEPLLKVNENNNMGRWVLNCLAIGLFVTIVAVVIIVNYMSVGNDFQNIISYSTFIAVIVMLLFGLFLARKAQQTVGPITYYFSKGENCRTKSSKYVMSSGDLIKITPVFSCFVLLLLFSYDPKDLGWKYVYIMIFGIFLGVFVSGLSYYGIEYFLIKQPIKQCDTASECSTIKDPTDYDGTMQEDLENANDNKKSLNIVKLIMLISLIVVVGYLIYKNVNK